MELINLQSLLWLLFLVAMLLGLKYSLVNRPVLLKWLSFICRIAAIILLAIALCRPYIVSSGNNQHVVAILDVSESVDIDAAIDRLNDIRQLQSSLTTSDKFTLFLSGSRLKQVESIDEAENVLNKWKETISDSDLRSESCLGELLLAGRYAFDADKVRKMVLYSDGVTTGGNISEVLSTLEKEHVAVYFEPVAALKNEEVSVVSLMPSCATAYTGQMVRLNAQLASNHVVDTTLSLIHDGVIVSNKQLQVKPDGDNQVYFDVPMVKSGSSNWIAEISAVSDHFTINNRAGCTVNVKGSPRLLILHQEPAEMRDFARAMKKQDIEVEVRGKYGLECSLQELLAFDAVMIADVPASDLSVSQMNMLKSYVCDFGGGFLMLGSENSFGLGGYYKTPIEEVLPIISRFEKEKEKPSMAMALVIDKSGSMEGMPIELAKQAAKAAVELLSPQDQVAVVAFDGQASIICPMSSAADSSSICSNIDSLAAGGGTYMYPGMETAYQMLEDTSAKIKHVIILSDGMSQEADHRGLAESMAYSMITVSTVAMGDGADRGLLSSIAELGRGRYYETNDPANVPQIFTRETMQASKSSIKEDLYSPLIISDHQILSGVSDTDLPFILGYVIAKPKPTGQVLMALETGDPLMAIGRYGLGAGVAYTSDMTDKWGGEWLVWDECGKFWAQVLRTVMHKADTDGLYVKAKLVDDRWIMNIKRTGPTSESVNAVSWKACMTDQDNNTHDIDVKQIGIGLYQAEAAMDSVTAASLNLHDVDYDKTSVMHYNRLYPREYDLTGQADEALVELDGLSAENVNEGDVVVSIYKPFANNMLLAAMAVFILGVLFRRL